MITLHEGNLLTEDVEALVNTVNTQGVMGKGVALQFKRAYPEMFQSYEAACRRGDVQPGRLHIWSSDALTGPRFVINFPTKRHWRQPSRLEDIDAGLVALVEAIRERNIRSIALPPLGCGNGGLDWRDVRPLIERRLAPVADEVDIRIFPPFGAPAAGEQVNRSPTPKLTPSRAMLLTLMRRYEEVAFGPPSLIEVQKLAYFLQVSGEPLGLRFANARYGPYSDDLRRTLSDLEGHYIVGFGDGSARVHDAEPLSVRPEVLDELDAFVSAQSDATHRIDHVLEMISGYESAYGLELLASVHKLLADEPERRPDVDAVLGALQEWTRRKATLFTRDHVSTARQAIIDRELLAG
ncbi:MAG: type II toxin-antitoxin system antitoxin DNA ADP-ribosyl glycohydrolase DarG [Dermatophilaceae bacterium]